MNQEKSKLIAKRLWKIWWLTLGVVSAVFNINVSYVTVKTGISPLKLFSGHQIASLLLTLLYFYPMLFVIRVYSQRAEMKKSVFVAQGLIVFLSVWLAASIITMIWTVLV